MRDETGKQKPTTDGSAADLELFEVLIAISVVARILAMKVITKGDKDEQNERTEHGAGRNERDRRETDRMRRRPEKCRGLCTELPYERG